MWTFVKRLKLKIENLDQSKDMLNTIENDINIIEFLHWELCGERVWGEVFSLDTQTSGRLGPRKVHEVFSLCFWDNIVQRVYVLLEILVFSKIIFLYQMFEMCILGMSTKSFDV
jgi:hypothetical protein